MASVSIGRSRFPPEEIRWLATSGIMVTSEPVRDSIVASTRSISAATSATNSSTEALEGLSKGTITATLVSTFAQFGLSLRYNNRKCRVTRQGHEAVEMRRPPLRRADKGEPEVAGIGSHQRYGTGFGCRRAARWREYPSSGAGPEHEHYRRLPRGLAAPDPGT